MTDAVQRVSSALADRYVIERELGAGGMATVYLAHDVRHDRKVALKVLRPELSAILGGDRFLAEIKTTANLQHPHILPLFDSGIGGSGERGNEFVYYVMPYVEGESLRDRLQREKQLPVDEAVRIAREVADALEYAHTHGIVHRDIKPENILLHGGHAMVADFGIALAASRSEGGTRMTETGMSLGTPFYMAPEQAMGEREITPKADIYALGCVLYEMLTAEPPFVGATAQAIIARVMTEAPRSLTLQRRTVPVHVEAAVRTALEKLPADRFPTAAAFAEALANPAFGAAEATRAGGVAAAGASLRRSPARRAFAVLPWALLLTVSGLLAWRELRAPEPAVRRQRVVLRETPFPPGGVGRVVAIAPDGETIVFRDTAGGVVQLWSKERSRLEATALAGTTGALFPTFSPDGEWIAFVADNRLKKVPRLGGSAITLADSASTSTWGSVAWLDNDTILYNSQTAFHLLAVHQDGGPIRTVLGNDNLLGQRGVTSITALPGGRAALIGTCTSGCTQQDIRSVDLATGRMQVLVEDAIKGWHTRDGHVVFIRQDGGVFRAPFDLGTLTFRHAPSPVMQGVRTIPGVADMVLGADGTALYSEGSSTVAGTPVEAVWVTRDGVATPVQSGWSFIPSSNPGMALSPDGRRLALSVRASGAEDIWIKELGGGPMTRLTFAGSNIRPEWTADGRSVMYISRQASGNEDLRIRAADGTGGERTLLDHARTVFEVVRTRDTSRLIVRLGVPPSRDIYLLQQGDSVLRPLLAEAHEEVTPALSADGRWLAYASNESGRYEVYVRPFPAVEGGRWQVSRDGGTEPRWSRSGRELFFRAGGTLMSAGVTPGASFVTGEVRTLFPVAPFLSGTNRQYYEVATDDRRFLFVRSLGGQQAVGPAYVTMVDNWLDELRAGARR
jgi:Tol biopolymer transport system component